MKNTQTICVSEACIQAFVFFVGDYETSSSTSTYCLHELAFNTDIQDKLRQKIEEKLDVRHNTSMSYEDVHAMPYLDKVMLDILYM